MENADAWLKWLKEPFFGIETYRYLLALAFVFSGFLARRIASWGLHRLALAAKKTRFSFDDVLFESAGKPASAACLLVGLYMAMTVLPLPSKPVDVAFFVHALFKSLTIVLGIWFAVRLIDGLAVVMMDVARGTESRIDDQLVPIIRKSLKVFTVIVGGVLMIQNMGYSVGSLVASFGIGGAAIAFASKDMLSNLFGSVIVFFDRPFEVGDWILVDGIEGTVEEVGLRTTRVRTFANSVITVPNAKFTTDSINNWSRMRKRRISFTIGVTYDATPEQIEAGVKAVRKLIADDPAMNQDFSLVNFEGFGDSSLNIFVYCFTKTTNWAEFLEAKQTFLLAIMREFKALGLDFAFPTRTVHVVGAKGLEAVTN